MTQDWLKLVRKPDDEYQNGGLGKIYYWGEPTNKEEYIAHVGISTENGQPYVMQVEDFYVEGAEEIIAYLSDPDFRKENGL